jgi:elongation factor P--(R)-beta-lysine ligase
MPHMRPSPWWNADVHADRRPFLRARGRIKAAIRGWFEQRGFTEVETAILQTSPGNEAHLHAFETTLINSDGTRRRLYLHTSPEFACKKLLAAGEKRIFTFASVFRNRERGALHHPEFTMLEWYRAGESYERLMDDCTALLAVAAGAADARRLTFRGVSADPHASPELLTVAQAFARFASIDLLGTISAASTNRDGLAQQALRSGIRIAADDTWADIFSRVLVQRIEPHLGVGNATLLTEYPSSQAALARRTPSDPRVAERFELYACAVELANGYGELGDAEEQRRRFEAEMEEKQRVYGERYPVDEDFLAALAHMPPASGIALGFDRLVMLATGASRIEQVLWTPVAEPGNETDATG